MSNQRLMKAKEKAGDGYAKTNAIARWGGRRGDGCIRKANASQGAQGEPEAKQGLRSAAGTCQYVEHPDRVQRSECSQIHVRSRESVKFPG